MCGCLVLEQNNGQYVPHGYYPLWTLHDWPAKPHVFACPTTVGDAYSNPSLSCAHFKKFIPRCGPLLIFVKGICKCHKIDCGCGVKWHNLLSITIVPNGHPSLGARHCVGRWLGCTTDPNVESADTCLFFLPTSHNVLRMQRSSLYLACVYLVSIQDVFWLVPPRRPTLQQLLPLLLLLLLLILG